MTDGFQVDPARLTEHAEQVRDIGVAAAEVPTAGNQVTPAGFDIAYGLMFQWWPQSTRPISTFLIESANDVVSAMNETANLLAATADAYRETDEHGKAELDEVAASLPGTEGGPR